MRSPFEPRFQLRVPEAELTTLARAYRDDDAAAERVGSAVRARGYLLLSELRELAVWKSRRIGRRIDDNAEAVVQEVSELALRTHDSGLAIRSLQLLSGVGWPMASVVLHFCSRERYPILDVRAMWTVGYDRLPSYTAAFWSAYTDFCRSLADRQRLSMRDVDRALWQYSSNERKMATQT